MARRRHAALFTVGVVLAGSTLTAAPGAEIATASRTGAVPLIQRVFHTHAVTPPTIQQCLTMFGIRCYQPEAIRNAYNLPELYERGLTGKGRTIAIVDSFGSPTIAADLAVFDAQFGIKAPPSFQVLQPGGPVPAFDPTDSTMVGWAFETTLDVEWAHVVAPDANIVLLETPVAEVEGIVGVPEMIQAENFAIDHGLADVISQSWGATEQTFASPAQLRSQRSSFANARRHGVSVLASSGDNGAASQTFSGTSFFPFPAIGWPASDPLVTAVGGTFLDLTSEGDRRAPDVTAADGPSGITSGSGKSAVFDRPAYQNNVQRIVGDRRGIPDISMSGACDGAVLVYDSFFGGPFYDPICGTSESSPLFAGIVAIADQLAGHRLGLVNSAIYHLLGAGHSGIVDVTQGNTTVTVCTANCSSSTPTMTTVPGFPALRGYDLATGVGTIDAPAFVHALAGRDS